MKRESLPYRKNVAIIVINDDGLLLACHRSDMKGAWQLPQGGIDKGETAEEAMWRELEEEIGTDEVELIGALPQPIHYEWPEELFSRGHRGQEQSYFLVRLSDESLIDLRGKGKGKQEFDRWEWTGADQFLERISGFKAGAYKQAIKELQKLFPGVIAS